MGAPSGQALFNFREDAKWDLSALSYEDWLNFIFDHPEGDDDWYWETEWEYQIGDNRVVLEYLIQLFSEPGVLLEKFNNAQLERGFWFLMGPAGFSDVAWDERIERERRVFFVRQHAVLFRKVFAGHSLDTSVYMWWDLFESGYRIHHEPEKEDDAALQDAILWTLGEILGMEEWHCVCSALHGLNHLHHQRVPEFIDYFLATKRGLDEAEEIRAYALACREGAAL